MPTVIAQFSVKADKINDFLTQCQEDAYPTTFRQNSEQANHYVFIEQWKSKADLEQHFATPHFTSIVPVLVEYCEQAPVVQTFQKVSE